ncbi:hypothetical protein RJT34_02850 [Clitoria ternatea]|uniref:Uncharacterized protein n=1 Tax=Clitoria ternatea TaxID=43366 RepID=A0AAN9Q171_CLITE
MCETYAFVPLCGHIHAYMPYHTLGSDSACVSLLHVSVHLYIEWVFIYSCPCMVFLIGYGLTHITTPLCLWMRPIPCLSSSRVEKLSGRPYAQRLSHMMIHDPCGRIHVHFITPMHSSSLLLPGLTRVRLNISMGAYTHMLHVNHSLFHDLGCLYATLGCSMPRFYFPYFNTPYLC